MTQPAPRHVTSVIVEEADGSVTVTRGLGDVISGDVEYFGYGVDYFGRDGNGGKRFGVRFDEAPSAHVFEWASATQANYGPDSVTLESDRIAMPGSPRRIKTSPRSEMRYCDWESSIRTCMSITG